MDQQFADESISRGRDGPIYGLADRTDAKATTMTVKELGELLGLKKTDSYWLVHKGEFRVTELYGRLRIDVANFEEWYAYQTTYRKKDGEEPGRKLHNEAYTALEIAEMLGIKEKYIYDVLKKENLKYRVIDHQKWYPKDAFEQWYKGQSRYRNKEDRAAEKERMEQTMSMPEMAEILDIPRQVVYAILKSPHSAGQLEVVWLQGRRRITKESFDRWYHSQKQYRKPADRTKRYKGNSWHYVNRVKEAKAAAEEEKRRKEAEAKIVHSGNPDYLTADEAAAMVNLKRRTLQGYIRKGAFKVVSFPGQRTLIDRKSFEEWLEKKGGRHGDDYPEE
jgi:excisionase family DNA binding protein